MLMLRLLGNYAIGGPSKGQEVNMKMDLKELN